MQTLCVSGYRKKSQFCSQRIKRSIFLSIGSRLILVSLIQFASGFPRDSSFSQSSFEHRKRRESRGRKKGEMSSFNRSIIQFAIRSLHDDSADGDASRCTARRNTEASRRRDAPDVTEYARDDAHVSLFVGTRSPPPLLPPPSPLHLPPSRRFLHLALSCFILLLFYRPLLRSLSLSILKAHRMEYQQVRSKMTKLTKVGRI